MNQFYVSLKISRYLKDIKISLQQITAIPTLETYFESMFRDLTLQRKRIYTLPCKRYLKIYSNNTFKTSKTYLKIN